MIIQERNQLYHSFIIKSLKAYNICKEYIVKFQMNDGFENFTHEPIVFVHYFHLLFHSFFQRNISKLAIIAFYLYPTTPNIKICTTHNKITEP